MSELFAKKGEEARDPYGVLLFTFARDVVGGDPIKTGDVILPNGDHPKPGQHVTRKELDWINARRKDRQEACR